MTLAATSRICLAASLAAVVSFSSGGLANPLSARAAPAQSAQSSDTAAHQRVASRETVASQESKSVRSQRARIVSIAESYVGARYRFGAEGMKAFDCSGLVFRVYQEAGLLSKISGARRGARAYYHWFRNRGLASRTDPKPGDLVIWHKGRHIGIYIGDGEIISALNKKYGVRVHGINFVSGFTAYLHVQLSGHMPDPNDGTGVPPTTVRATVDHLIVRNGPGNGHRRVAVVDRGTRINVTDRARDAHGRKWLKGELPSGKIGWVRARHVRVAG